MSVVGDVIERKFYHWATPEFMQAANNAATVEFTTTPNLSWYWRSKLASRAWATSTPPPGFEPLGELLTHGKYTSEVLKEYVFEEVRAKEFSERPTRRRAMFLFDLALEPNHYAATMNLRTQHLFEVTVRAGRLHRADLTALDCNAALHSEMAEHARRYWAVATTPTLTTEVLFEGECIMQYVHCNKNDVDRSG